MDEEIKPWLRKVPKNQGIVSVSAIKEGEINCCVAWYCHATVEDAEEMKDKIVEFIREEHVDFVVIRRVVHKPHGVRGLGRRDTTISHPNNFRMDFRYCTALVTKRWFNIHVSTRMEPNSRALFGGIWDSPNVAELNALVKGGAPANTPVRGVGGLEAENPSKDVST